jgi:carbohydrate-selective porin OprB
MAGERTRLAEKGVNFDLQYISDHHATALWQGGGNLGQFLGLLSSPAGISSGNTFRLDSWWLEKRVLNERIAVLVGQFAVRTFTAHNVTQRPSPLSPWDTPWAICPRPSRRSIHPQLRRWSFGLFHVAISM